MSNINPFNNRVFGCAVIKAINSNFNADFTHQPRTLPDGRVYATDKALKYSVRHYLIQQYPDEKIMYYKRLNDNMNPLSLADSYDAVTQEGSFDKDYKDKHKVLGNVLNCLDVRLFGSTFAPKKGSNKVNLSVHGSVQITHALNQFEHDNRPINEIYSEQITAPFRSDGAKGDEAEQTTIGRQSKLREGHYVYHFSINPQNLKPLVDLVNQKKGNQVMGLTGADVEKLKEGLRCGVTHFDSSSKAGSDNEMMLWVQLKEGSKRVLPSFAEMITVTRENGTVKINLQKVKDLLKSVEEDVEKTELYYLPDNTKLEGTPDNAGHYHIFTNKSLS